MVWEIAGQWPWETGAMVKGSEQSNSVTMRSSLGPEVPMYTLPLVKDHRAENGRRPAAVRDLARLREVRAQGTDDYFRWR